MHSVTAIRPSQPICATTAGLPDHERFGFWQDVVCRAVVELECQPHGNADFMASVEGARLSALSVAQIQGSPHRVSRGTSGIARSQDASLIFNFMLSGVALVEQDGRSIVLTPGDGSVCDAQRPYRLRFDEAFKLITVKLPSASLAHRCASVHRITARSMAQASQMCPVVFSYLSGFSQHVARLDGQAADKIGHNFTELLRAALDEMILEAPLPLSEYRASALIRVKDFVERRLEDCDLDVGTVSAALSLSPRYINKLFEAEETSLSRYIWRRRLERSAHDLRDPSRQRSGITEVAMSNGFSDMSHFSRAFRQRFSMSPRAYRDSATLTH